MRIEPSAGPGSNRANQALNRQACNPPGDHTLAGDHFQGAEAYVNAWQECRLSPHNQTRDGIESLGYTDAAGACDSSSAIEKLNAIWGKASDDAARRQFSTTYARRSVPH